MNFTKLVWIVMAVALAMFVWPTDSKAEDQVYGDEHMEFCQGAIQYANEYMTSDKLPEVISAQLKIIHSDKVGDMEKFISLTAFLVYQQIAYNWETFQENGNSLESFNNTMLNNCIDTMSKYEVVQKRPGTAAEGQTYDSIY